MPKGTESFLEYCIISLCHSIQMFVECCQCLFKSFWVMFDSVRENPLELQKDRVQLQLHVASFILLPGNGSFVTTRASTCITTRASMVLNGASTCSNTCASTCNTTRASTCITTRASTCHYTCARLLFKNMPPGAVRGPPGPPKGTKHPPPRSF